jgi:hypothetical protein
VATNLNKSAILRPVPATSFEPVSGIVLDDLVGDGSPNNLSQKIEQFSRLYLPLSFIKIASKVSGVIDYPDEGTNTLPAQTGTASQVTLPAVNAPVVTGLLIALVGGTGAGQVRRIGSLASGSTYNLNNFQMSGGSVLAWSPQPDSTSKFRLLIDTYKLGLIVIKAEFSLATNSLVVVPAMFGLPVGNVPTRFEGGAASMVNLGYTTDNQQAIDDTTVYNHGSVQTAGTAGAIGAKVRAQTLTGGGSFSLWVACS